MVKCQPEETLEKYNSKAAFPKTMPAIKQSLDYVSEELKCILKPLHNLDISACIKND